MIAEAIDRNSMFYAPLPSHEHVSTYSMHAKVGLAAVPRWHGNSLIKRQGGHGGFQTLNLALVNSPSS